MRVFSWAHARLAPWSTISIKTVSATAPTRNMTFLSPCRPPNNSSSRRATRQILIPEHDPPTEQGHGQAHISAHVPDHTSSRDMIPNPLLTHPHAESEREATDRRYHPAQRVGEDTPPLGREFVAEPDAEINGRPKRHDSHCEHH